MKTATGGNSDSRPWLGTLVRRSQLKLPAAEWAEKKIPIYHYIKYSYSCKKYSQLPKKKNDIRLNGINQSRLEHAEKNVLLSNQKKNVTAWIL